MRFDGDYTMTIGGKGVAGATTFDVLNPANEQVIGQAPDASREQLDEAVAAARKAYPAWAATPIAKRKELLLAMAGAIAAKGEDLKRLLTSEQGKPHGDAFGDVMGGAYWLQATASLDLPVHVVETRPSAGARPAMCRSASSAPSRRGTSPSSWPCSSWPRPCWPATRWC